MSDTFLQPIEKPKGLIMNLAYYFTRRQFGKVLTPLKVHSARLPAAFGLFYAKVNKLDQKLTLPTRAGPAHSASGRARQHLSFLHRYRPGVHDPGVDESSEV